MSATSATIRRPLPTCGPRGALLLGLLLTTFAEGCARPPLAAPVGRSDAPIAPPEGGPGDDVEPAPEPPPPAEAPALLEIEVPGFGSAVVVTPRGEGPRPVLVVAHGAGDRPEWHCELWRPMVRGAGFVLCPRGKPIDARAPDGGRIFYYPDHHALSREVAAAVSALSTRFGDRVDLRDPVYAGYSQGAIMGALLLPGHPARFARAALIEGGYGGFGEWTLGTARRFRGGGGARVLLACGGADCAAQARKTQAMLERGGVTTRVLHAEGAGHSYGGLMERALHEAYPWVVEGDPRWLGGAAPSPGAAAPSPGEGAAAQADAAAMLRARSASPCTTEWKLRSCRTLP
ncbi:hypothetical protein WMF28_40770 [Sorangium sp. So ce590]|uniref:alpha/beta hydrolase n=1 Tax=Sorangium sp. So ce590 TaxID=3133317 RepID=UPI003F5E672E